MASLETKFGSVPALSPTVGERRLQAEWDLLQELATLNPARLARPARKDFQFELNLMGTPALLPGTSATRAEHSIRVVYPRFFPSLPLELYLAEPVLHPNVHPVTGFVCLWDRHRIGNTVEHALHKTVAILGWQLLNPEPRHVMQPKALELPADAVADGLRMQPLAGIQHTGGLCKTTEPIMRRRLS